MSFCFGFRPSRRPSPSGDFNARGRQSRPSAKVLPTAKRLERRKRAAAQKGRSSPLYIPRHRFPDAGVFCYPFAQPLRRSCRRRFASTRSSWGWLKAETLTRTVPFSRVPAV